MRARLSNKGRMFHAEECTRIRSDFADLNNNGHGPAASCREGLCGRHQGAMRGRATRGGSYQGLREGSFRGPLRILPSFARQGCGGREGLRRRCQAKLRWHKAGWRSDRGLRKVSFRRFQRCLQGCGDAGRSGQDLKAKLMPCRLGDAVRRTPAARSTKLTRSQRGHTKEDGFCRRSISGDRHTDAGYWSPFMVKCSAVVEAA